MDRTLRRAVSTLLAGLLAGSLSFSAARAQEPEGQPRTERAGKPRPAKKKKGKAETAATWHARRSLLYQRKWGVDIVGVRPVSSGYMLRFDYRVVDPRKAAVLTDRRARPYLIDEATRTALAVPAMENVGELRQVAPLEPDRTYFVIFGNPGKLVKAGSRVTIVVGNFRVEGLVVG